jgi:hypothetical protein
MGVEQSGMLVSEEGAMARLALRPPICLVLLAVARTVSAETVAPKNSVDGDTGRTDSYLEGERLRLDDLYLL